LLTNRQRKVLLFSPPYSGKVLGPPLGVLSLAGSLRQAGYQPKIVDGALDRNFAQIIAAEIEDSLCIGVSLLTGPMIHDAIAVSKLVRRLRPGLPIIFGGWHPSLQTAQTLREPFVDVVVRHQGEKTLIELLGRIENGNSLDLVAGCWFKRSGQIQQNEDRAATPIADLPAPAYDLVDWDAYERASGERKLPYGASIGCPYACNYCTDTVFYNRRFNPYGVEHVVREIGELVDRYRLTEVALVDSNFLVDVHRAVAIAQGFLDAGVKCKWTFQASTDLLCRMTDEEVQLLADSGVSHIGFGTESASPEILRKMNKRHQSIADMFEAARKCRQADIRVTYNLIFGYPGEEESHRRETLRVMGQIAEQFDNVTFSPNVFTAYPGIPIWPELEQLGVREPATLEEWASIDLGVNRMPWLRGEAYATLRRGISYFLLHNEVNRARRKSRSAIVRSLLDAVAKPLRWRIRHHCFGSPVELQLAMVKRWLVVRRSLLTGQALSRALGRTS
jgi:anaerobic magnesium-protoporphyrin IX monomethyl ester cyclase